MKMESPKSLFFTTIPSLDFDKETEHQKISTKLKKEKKMIPYINNPNKNIILKSIQMYRDADLTNSAET